MDTPGHTQGHVSFYAAVIQTLIARDLVVLDSGVLKLPFPQYAFDLGRAKKSIMAVAELAIRRIICYHGGDTVLLLIPESMTAADMLSDARKVFANYKAALKGSGIRCVIGLSSGEDWDADATAHRGKRVLIFYGELELEKLQLYN